GAFTVYVNRSSLSTKDRARIQVGDGSRTETVEKLLTEHLARQPSRSPGLKGEEGLRKARELLRVLGEDQKSGNAQDREEAVIRSVERILLGPGELGPEGALPDGGPDARGKQEAAGGEKKTESEPEREPEMPVERKKRGRKKAPQDQKKEGAGQKKLFDG
ncbi:MAG: hypothetical protein PHO89_11655, partial [Methylacidiphilaceae bacterium]|nr:hypothetical protein [Candidatus Methylacidiphilaceae bacterium]